MTAPDPRLGEIEARLVEATNLGLWETTRANDVVIYDPNGFGAYRKIAHADTKQDAEFIAYSPTDVAYLLAELRKRDDALARVEKLRQELFDVSSDDGGSFPVPARAAYRDASRAIRAAATAATGGTDA